MEFNTIISKPMNHEGGYVMIGTLFILSLVMIIGMGATTDTTLEIQIAGNDRTHKETFYQADGGTHIAIRLVEENLGITSAFTDLTVDNILIDPDTPNNTILIVDNTLWDNANGWSFTNPLGRTQASVSDGLRDFAYFPGGYNPALSDPNSLPHTNIIVDGATGLMTGASLQQLAGYEGKGYGAADGGAKILYTIYSQHIGRNQSESVVAVQWRHIIGLELEGRYK